MQVRPAAGGPAAAAWDAGAAAAWDAGAAAAWGAGAAAARGAPVTAQPAGAEARGLLPTRGRAGPWRVPGIPGMFT
jgi:hypothetical protein